jgi:Ni/Co efflux regulator RcnB
MKKTISALVVAAMMVPALAMAQPGRDEHRGPDGGHDRGGDHRGPAMRGPGGPAMRGPGGPGGRPDGWHQFRRGERFDRARAWNYADVDYRRYRGLRAPPRGYHWVRNGNDALLVGITSGIVASVIAGAIR